MEGQNLGSLGVQRAADCNRAAGLDRREESLRAGKGFDDPAYCGCICEVLRISTSPYPPRLSLRKDSLGG
jgi:hypothetical protein